MVHRSRFTSGGYAFVVAIALYGTAVFAAEQEPKKEAPTAPVAVAAVPQDGPVAKVNGVEVKAVDLRRARKILLSNQRGASLTPEQMKEVDTRAVSQLVAAELLYQAGAKLEIKDLEKQVEAKVTQGKARFANEKEFEKAIKDLEMDEKDIREYTRRDVVIANFIENSIVSKIKVSEEEARSFYDKNTDKFSRPETVKASHILIGVDAKATDDDKKKAREKAEKVRKELVAGGDFALLAKENSTCPSKQKGGDLGFFGKGQMVAPFEQAAFGLKPGELSTVVETQFGYHIIKLTDKKAAETVSFQDARSKIEDYLKGQKVNTAVGDYVTEARKTAKIDMLLK